LYVLNCTSSNTAADAHAESVDGESVAKNSLPASSQNPIRRRDPKATVSGHAKLLRTVSSEITAPPRDQVDDQHNQRNNQQNVNQAAGNMEAEAQKPQNEEDDKDCPEHSYSFFTLRTPENRDRSPASKTHLAVDC
jgi:hypothetical protein